jgi:TPR repeat protein
VRARLFCAFLAAAFSGCAHAAKCPPIHDYKSVAISSLECAAGARDKLAQLELGIRYETGKDVIRDLDRAEHFYALAARTDREHDYTYVPPVGHQKYGRVASLGNGAVRPGLIEAAVRLERLRKIRKGSR